MAKVKGIKKLNKVIKKQLAPFGIEKVFMDTEFAYYYNDKISYAPVMINDFQGQAFLAFIEKRFGYTTKMPFMLFLLHEVGHHIANENIVDDIAEFCEKEKDRIQAEMDLTDDEAEIMRLDDEYFNLPDEIMATQWAVNYMRKHPRITKRMWFEIAEELEQFYEANGVETAE